MMKFYPVCMGITLIVLTYAVQPCRGTCRLRKKPSPDELSDHWARCSAILKKGAERSCTQTRGSSSCVAKRTQQPEEEFCDASTHGCPTVLSSIRATVYKKDLLVTRPGCWWFGINVTWTVNATGTHQDFEKKTFLLRADILHTPKVYYAEIEATLHENDYVDGMATLHYDCIYPISDNQSYSVDIVMKAKPHAERDIQFTHVETIPNPVVTSRPLTQGPRAAAPRVDTTTHKMSPDPGLVSTTQPMVTTEPTMPERQSQTWPSQNPGLMYGLMGGSLGLVTLVMTMFFVRKHWPRRQHGAFRQKIAILALNDDKTAKLYDELLKRLHCSLNCTICVLQDVALDRDAEPYDLLKSEMTSASHIIICISKRLIDLTSLNVPRDFARQQKSRDAPQIVLSLLRSELLLSPIHQSNIVAIQFGDPEIGQETPYLSPWKCLLFPDDMNKLVGYLKGDGTLTERNEMASDIDDSQSDSDSDIPLCANKDGSDQSDQIDYQIPPVPNFCDAYEYCRTQALNDNFCTHAPNRSNTEHYHQPSDYAAQLGNISVSPAHEYIGHPSRASNGLSRLQVLRHISYPVVPNIGSDIDSVAIENEVHEINSGQF